MFDFLDYAMQQSQPVSGGTTGNVARAGAGATTNQIAARSTARAATPAATAAPAPPVAPSMDAAFPVSGVIDALNATSADVQRARAAHATIVLLAVQAEQAAATPGDAAAMKVATALHDATDAVATFAAIDARYRQAARQAAQLPPGFRPPDDDGVLIEELRARIITALDRAVRASFRAAPHAMPATGFDFTPRAAAGAAVVEARAALGRSAVALGWQPATTAADADAARYAHEACPVDADRAVCSLQPVEREALRRKLAAHVADAVTHFATACAQHRATLTAAVKKRAAADKFVVGIFTDVLSTGVAMLPGGKAVQFVAKLGLKAGINAITRSPQAPEQKTIDALDAILQAMTKQLTSITDLCEQLVDADLIDIEAALAHVAAAGAAPFAAKLAPIVAAFRQQIEPLGTSTANPYADDVAARTSTMEHGIGTYEVVWIQTMRGRRLAQVNHVTTHGPIVDDAATQTYAFLRWVDPIFEPMVAAQAGAPDASRVLNADRVVDVPLMD